MTTRAEYEARREAVAARMTADARLFDMKSFASKTDCGTACCIAGYTLLEMGAKFNFILDGFLSNILQSITLDGKTTEDAHTWAIAASDYLGLPEFDWSNLKRNLFYRFDLTSPEDAALALKTAPYREE